LPEEQSSEKILRVGRAPYCSPGLVGASMEKKKGEREKKRV